MGTTELRLEAGDAVHGTIHEALDPKIAVRVVVVSGSGGGDAVSSAFARSLARAGVAVALGVGYFKVPGRPEELRDVPLEYFAGAVDAVRAAGGAAAARPVVLLGTSRGSEAALLTAVHFPGAVDAVVGLVPADVAFGSPGGGAAWTLAGRALPCTTSYGPDRLGDAAIPIERFGGPVLLVSAGADEIWPSSTMAASLAARSPRCAHLDYPDATHALSFLAPVRDASARPADVAARADAWPRLLDFLRTVT